MTAPSQWWIGKGIFRWPCAMWFLLFLTLLGAKVKLSNRVPTDQLPRSRAGGGCRDKDPGGSGRAKSGPGLPGGARPRDLLQPRSPGPALGEGPG